MKKTILILAAAGLVFASAEAKDKKTKKQEVAPVVPVKVLTNEIDSMSYALGMNVGADFAKNIKGIPGGKSNVDMILKGFSAAMKGDSTLLKSEFAVEYFRNFITKAQKADMDKKKIESQQFLTNNMSKEGVKTTASGLQYQVLKATEGAKPNATDTVEVHYTGTLIDGTVFDSSVERGQSISFPLNGVIKGWTEGVQLMSVGSKYKFFIPSELAYGEQGAGQLIGPNSTLIFEVELLSIKPYKAVVAPAEVKAAPTVKASKITPAKKTKK